MVALSMSLAISIMITSFRDTVNRWFENSIQGDFYITDSERDYDAGLLAPALLAEVARLDGISAVNRYRNLRYSFNQRLIRLTGVDSLVLKEYSRYDFTAREDSDPWQAVSQGAAMISETLARKHGLQPGDRLTLKGLRAPREFRVTAVFRDYITEHGVVLLDFAELADLMGDQRV